MSSTISLVILTQSVLKKRLFECSRAAHWFSRPNRASRLTWTNLTNQLVLTVWVDALHSSLLATSVYNAVRTTSCWDSSLPCGWIWDSETSRSQMMHMNIGQDFLSCHLHSVVKSVGRFAPKSFVGKLSQKSSLDEELNIQHFQRTDDDSKSSRWNTSVRLVEIIDTSGAPQGCVTACVVFSVHKCTVNTVSCSCECWEKGLHQRLIISVDTQHGHSRQWETYWMDTLRATQFIQASIKKWTSVGLHHPFNIHRPVL